MSNTFSPPPLPPPPAPPTQKTHKSLIVFGLVAVAATGIAIAAVKHRSQTDGSAKATETQPTVSATGDGGEDPNALAAEASTGHWATTYAGEIRDQLTHLQYEIGEFSKGYSDQVLAAGCRSGVDYYNVITTTSAAYADSDAPPDYTDMIHWFGQAMGACADGNVNDAITAIGVYNIRHDDFVAAISYMIP